MTRSRLLLAAALLAAPGCSDETVPVTADATADMRTSGPDTGAARDSATDGSAGDTGVADASADAPPPVDKWQSVTSPPLTLVGHTATLLSDGRVLIVGGYVKAGGQLAEPQTAAYLYLPDMDTIVAAGDLSVARGHHSATRLDDGRVLIAGGRAPALDSTEIYDPTKTGQAAWSSGPSITGPRYGHAAVKLGDGSVLLVGGIGAAQLDTLERYTPGGGFATLGQKLAHKRAGMTATSLDSGKVLIAGGFDGSAHLASVEVYDPGSGAIAELATGLGEARSAHSATRLQNGSVLVVGGWCGAGCGVANDELYEPSTDKITPLAHAGSPPRDHAAVLLADGRLFVCGDGANTQRLKRAAIYSPIGAGSWTAAAEMLAGRFNHTATRLADGSVLVIGGQNIPATIHDGYVTSVERYIP